MKKYSNEIELFTLAFFGVMFGGLGLKNIFLAALLCASIKLLLALIIRRIAHNPNNEKTINSVKQKRPFEMLIGLMYLIVGAYFAHLAYDESYTISFIDIISETENFIVDKDTTEPLFSTKNIRNMIRFSIALSSLILISFSISNFIKSTK